MKEVVVPVGELTIGSAAAYHGNGMKTEIGVGYKPPEAVGNGKKESVTSSTQRTEKPSATAVAEKPEAKGSEPKNGEAAVAEAGRVVKETRAKAKKVASGVTLEDAETLRNGLASTAKQREAQEARAKALLWVEKMHEKAKDTYSTNPADQVKKQIAKEFVHTPPSLENFSVHKVYLLSQNPHAVVSAFKQLLEAGEFQKRPEVIRQESGQAEITPEIIRLTEGQEVKVPSLINEITTLKEEDIELVKNEEVGKKKKVDSRIVYEHAAIVDPEERIKRAEAQLGRVLTPAQRKALIEAHEEGNAVVYEYTKAQLLKKLRILRSAGLTKEEANMLLRVGLAGRGREKARDEGRNPTPDELRSDWRDAMRIIMQQQKPIQELAYQSGFAEQAREIDDVVAHASRLNDEDPATYRAVFREVRSMRNVLGEFHDIVAFVVPGIQNRFEQIVTAANEVNVTNAFYLLKNVPGFAAGVRFYTEALKQQLLLNDTRRLTDPQQRAANEQTIESLKEWFGKRNAGLPLENRLTEKQIADEASFIAEAANRYARAGMLVHSVIGGEWSRMVEGAYESYRNPLWGPVTSQFAPYAFTLERAEEMPDATRAILEFVGKDYMNRMYGQRDFHGSFWRDFQFIKAMNNAGYENSGLFARLKLSHKDEADFNAKIAKMHEKAARLKKERKESLEYLRREAQIHGKDTNITDEMVKRISEAEEKFDIAILEEEQVVLAFGKMTTKEREGFLRRGILEKIAVFEPHKIAEQYFDDNGEMDNLLVSFSKTGGSREERLKDGKKRFYEFSKAMADAREQAFAEGRDIRQSDIDAAKAADPEMYDALNKFVKDHIGELMKPDAIIGPRQNVNYGNLGDESDIPHEVLEKAAELLHSKPYGRMWGDMADGYQAMQAVKAILKNPTDMKAFAGLRGKFAALVQESGEKEVIMRLSEAVLKFSRQSGWLDYAPPGVGRLLHLFGVRISPAEKGLGILAPAWDVWEIDKQINQLVKDNVIDYKDGQKLKKIMGVTLLSRSVPFLYIILVAILIGMVFEIVSASGLKLR